EWVNKLDEENLRLYLIQSLHALILSLPSHRLSPSLLATDLRLSISPRNPIPPSGTKVTKTSQKYSNLFPDSTEIWLARLQIAGKNADSELIKKTWKEARKLAKGDTEELLQVWLYVVDSHEQMADKIKLYEDILLDSMQHSSASLHPNLLNRYIADLYSGPLSIPRRHSVITRIFQLYLPSPTTYAHLFQCESKCSESSLKNLELIFDKWRVAPGEAVNSACQWASWLVQNGKGKEAKDVIERARLGDPGTKQELDVKWMGILQAEQEDAKTHDEDEHHDIDMNDAGIDVFMN
ncbi:U3 snoRNP protein, partial [Tulasnella sp. 418]